MSVIRSDRQIKEEERRREKREWREGNVYPVNSLTEGVVAISATIENRIYMKAFFFFYESKY